MTPIAFTLFGAPRTKKNHQNIFKNKKTGKVFVSTSSAYKDYIKEMEPQLPKLEAPINEKVNVRCLFYLPTRRKCDLTNLLEAVDDLMIGKIIEDDNYTIIGSHDGSRVYYDKEAPRTEVFIEDYT